MIVELFGPPGAGKTTFARALVTHLRDRGHPADLLISSRPAETPRADGSTAPAGPVPAIARRIGRPAVEIMQLAAGARKDDMQVSTALLRIMPPRSLVWTVRLAQYLARLSRLWRLAAGSGRIVLFDQAFIQAVCSLALLSDRDDDDTIDRALTTTPRSDLAIHMMADADVLAERLRLREREQSFLERWFELDLATNLEAAALTSRIDGILNRQRRATVAAFSLDDRSQAESLATIETWLLDRDFRRRLSPHGH